MQHSESRGDFVKLLKKYLEGDVTPEEKQFVESYYDHFEMEPDVLAGYSQQQKQHLEQRMANSLQQKIESNQLPMKPLWKTWHYAAAASVLILLSIGLYFTQKENPR